MPPQTTTTAVVVDTCNNFDLASNISHTKHKSDGASANENVTPTGVGEASPLRQALPQFLACMAKNLLLLDLGMAIGFPTIVIPVLLGLQPDRNPGEVIEMSGWEATWVGKSAGLSESFAI